MRYCIFMLMIVLVPSLIFATPQHVIRCLREITLPQCDEISAVAVMPQGGMAVGDSLQHAVHIYDKDSAHVLTFGKLKKTDDGFETIDAMAVGPDGLLYISGHFQNVSIFTSQGEYKGALETGTAFIRSIIASDSRLILGSPTSPLIRIIRDDKVINSFGAFPEYYKSYPSGAYIALAADAGAIYCAMPLSYPIAVYDYDGKKLREIGSPDLMIKPYKTLDQVQRKDFRAISAIQTVALWQDKLISVQLLPKDDTHRYAWDVFSLSGELLDRSIRTDLKLLGADSDNLLLVDRKYPNRLVIGVLAPGDVK